MNLEQAKNIITHEQNPPFGRLGFAAAILCSLENADNVALSELIECLKRGNQLGSINLVNEVAALALYTRTKRKRHEGVLPYENFVTDTDDWLCYLKENRFM
jgi:hypothetical protein